MIKVGIVGASGYSGSELLRFLVGHPGGTTGRSSALLKHTRGNVLRVSFRVFAGFSPPNLNPSIWIL